MKEDPIDPEKLAAFLDGTLNEAERDEVLRQLARSRRAFDTLAGAAAVLSDIDEDAKAARRGSWWQPVPGSGRWFARRVVVVGAPTLIAAALATVLLLPGMKAGNPDPVLLAASIVADGRATMPGLPVDWDAAGWSPMRGAAPTLEEEARAFRVGARLLTLEFAWQDRTMRGSVGADVVAMLKRVEGATHIVGHYERMLEHGASAEERRDAARDVRTILLDSPWHDLGVWSQAARIAAGMRSAQFFEGRRARDRLTAVVSALETGNGDRPAPAALQRVVTLMRDGIQASEWESLVSALDSVIRESAR